MVPRARAYFSGLSFITKDFDPPGSRNPESGEWAAGTLVVPASHISRFIHGGLNDFAIDAGSSWTHVRPPALPPKRMNARSQLCLEMGMRSPWRRRMPSVRREILREFPEAEVIIHQDPISTVSPQGRAR